MVKVGDRYRLKRAYQSSKYNSSSERYEETQTEFVGVVTEVHPKGRWALVDFGDSREGYPWEQLTEARKIGELR